MAALFRNHHGELVRLAVLMVGDLPTAEDVVQDVYASLHSRPRQPDDPLPYVRAAVLNGCRSALRRRGVARRAGRRYRRPPPLLRAVRQRGRGPPGRRDPVRLDRFGRRIGVSPPHQAGWKFQAYAMAAAPGGRTFYAAYIAIRPDSCLTCAPPQLWIYRVSPADPGLVRIKGGVITVSPDVTLGFLGSMAVSPDGTRLALTAGRPAHGTSAPGLLDKIVVVGLRTGSQTVWQGGLNRPKSTLLISDVSWTPDGRSIVFLALWCGAPMTNDRCENESGPAGTYGLQVRSILVASGGGLLSYGTTLLTPGLLSRGAKAPIIVHALAGPRPGELTLVLLSGRIVTTGSWPEVTVERVAALTGAVLGIEYRLVTRPDAQPPASIAFGADASGQHLLLAYRAGGGWRAGWIGSGKLHLFPVRQPGSAFLVMAW